MAVFAALVLLGAVEILPSRGPGMFIGYSILLCVVLVFICWLKGEPPRWRSGAE